MRLSLTYSRMNTLLFPGAAMDAGALPADRTCCEVVIAYADLPAARKAEQIYERLIQPHGAGCDFNCTWWTFEQFHAPEQFAAACAAAGRADVVLLGTSGVGELPSVVKSWVDVWTAWNTEHDRALIAVLGCDREGKAAPFTADEHLERIARERQLDYFTAWFEPHSELPSLSPAAVAERAGTVTPLLAAILANPAAQPA